MVAACALLLSACLTTTPLEDLGSSFRRAMAVNEHGVIVGNGLDSTGALVGVWLDPDTGAVTPVPGLDGGPNEALGVNDHGVIVGTSFAGHVPCPLIPGFPCQSPETAVDHAYAYDAATGELVDLDELGVHTLRQPDELLGNSTAVAVNDAGVVVGTTTSIGPPTSPLFPFTPHLRAFAFDLTTGTVTDLSAFGLFQAVDINEHGQVLGDLEPFFGRAAVVDLQTGTVTELTSLGASRVRGFALNDNGLVVGEAQLEGNLSSHAFVYDLTTGVLTDIGTLKPRPASPSSSARSVNNAGIVVGTSFTADGLRAFAYDIPTKHMKDLGPLPPPQAATIEARDINEAGVAVGFGQGAPDRAWRTTVTRHY